MNVRCLVIAISYTIPNAIVAQLQYLGIVPQCHVFTVHDIVNS